MTEPLKSMTENNIPEAFSADHVYETKSKQELILFYHAACFSPTKRTFADAIKRNAFTSWPGLTVELGNKYFLRKEATTKVHIRQHYKGTQSTRLKQEVPITTQQELPEILTKQTNQLFLKVTKFPNKIYTDKTGRFPVTSSQGYKYIMIAYDYDSNNILAEPLKSSTSLHIKNAYHKMRKLLCSRGRTPKMHVLDNEYSEVLKEYMEEENETFQLMPPHLHRQKAAYRAIKTFKNHFISGIVSTHKYFPIHLWCRLFTPAIVTLNLLCPSIKNPTLSENSMAYSISMQRHLHLRKQK